MSTSHREKSSDFYAYFLRAYPGRTVLMIALMVVAGMAEGFGVLSLIPLLDFAQAGSEPSSTAGRLVVHSFQLVGLAPTVGLLLVTIVIAIGVKAYLLWHAQRQVGFTVAGVSRDLRLELIRALFDVRWRFFVERRSGEVAASVTRDATKAAAAYREGCTALAEVFQVLVYLSVATAISWKVASGTLLIGAALTVTFRRFFSASREAGRDQTRLTKSLSSQLVDILQGIKALKAMSREDLVWPLLEADTEGLNLAERRQVSAAEALKAFQEPILTLLLATGLYVLLVIMNQRLVSVLVLAFVFYRLMQHINTLQIRYQVMAVGESAFFSIREQIDQAHAQREVYSGTRDPGRIQDSIRIENVHFSYGAEPVLRGVDLEIPAGTFVSVSGESGSGKTTLADLLVGLHEPSSGRIVVDGVPLDEIDMSQWRSRIGYVPQEMLLFHGTVLQNVTLGDESLTEEDARRALEMAGAWGFVQAKAGGLHRQLGEKGGLLSGGQRQRIAIARGLVTDPTLLILDEVTTALDPETEQEIATTLRELAGSVTIFSISHQPALREVSDVAYLMQKGRLVRIGRTPAFEGEASRA